MMSLTSIETKHLISKGFEPDRVKNPFIYHMWQYNEFKLGDHITSIGAAFYIVPFVNAMVRSGTQEEKKLLFESMLTHMAFDEVVTDHRDHKGELFSRVKQAILVVGRVKTRQTKAEKEGMKLIEKMIEDNNMLEHKVLLFLMEPGEIDRNIAGLIANKIMAKYQRPTCILTKCIETEEWVDHDGENTWTVCEDIISYQGSARGYTKSGVENFKEICENTEDIMYASGHHNAFGLGILAEDIDSFIEKTDKSLSNMTDEPIYYVDYIFNREYIPTEIVFAIAELEHLWGQDVDEPNIVLENLTVTPDMVTVYVKTNNTLKIHLENNVDIMLFNAPDDLCQTLQSEGSRTLNIVGTCNKNVYKGRITPQLTVKDYEIIGQTRWVI